MSQCFCLLLRINLVWAQKVEMPPGVTWNELASQVTIIQMTIDTIHVVVTLHVAVNNFEN